MLHCRLAVGGRGLQAGGGADARSEPDSSAMWPRSSGPPWSWRRSGTPGSRRRPTPTKDTVSSTVMATAMVAGGVTVGAIQVVNKRTGTGAFDEQRPGAAGGTRRRRRRSLRNAQLHGAERRARDLAVLLEISREITATLDLDRVLHSVVNLASRALTFDRGAVWLVREGQVRHPGRRRAGDGGPDRTPGSATWSARAEWAAGRGEPLYLTDREDPASDAERLFVTIFGQDLANDQVRSGLYLPLKDEEGVLGVILFESAAPSSRARPSGRSRRSWPTRPASPCATRSSTTRCRWWTPSAPWRPRSRRCWRCPAGGSRSYVAAAVLLLAALTLIRWPLRVPAHDPVFRPNGYAPVRALVDWHGRADGGRGREAGSREGTCLAVLRATSLAGEREATAADASSADRLASLAASRGDAAEERLHRIRGEALRRELSLLDEELGLTSVRAPAAGMVLTPRLEEQTGPHSPRATSSWCSAERTPSSSSSAWSSATSFGSGPGRRSGSGWMPCLPAPSAAG